MSSWGYVKGPEALNVPEDHLCYFRGSYIIPALLAQGRPSLEPSRGVDGN